MTDDLDIGFFEHPLSVGIDFVKRLDPKLVSSFAYVQLQAAAQGVDETDVLWLLLCGACCRNNVYTCVLDGIINYGVYDSLLKDYRDTRAVLAVERTWSLYGTYEYLRSKPGDYDYDLCNSLVAWRDGMLCEEDDCLSQPLPEHKKLHLHSALFSRSPYMYAKWFSRAAKVSAPHSGYYGTLKHALRLFEFKLQKETEADRNFKVDSEIVAAMEKKLAEMNNMQMHLN